MRNRRGAAGFTLVEVIVALTLVSLVMVGLIAALRAFGDAGTRLEARIERAEDMRLVSAFLRQIVGDASIKHMRRLADGSSASYFQGDAQSLEWLAPMPARHGVGGLHRLRLSLHRGPGGGQLVLQFVPYLPAVDDASLDWSAEPARVLADEVDGFALQYQRLGHAVWEDVWRDSVVLPGRVRLRLAAAGQPWPDLVLAVLAAEEGQDASAEGFD